MKLREIIRSIVREVIGTDLHRIVREVLLEELSEEAPRTETSKPSRSESAKLAAKTRAANKAAAERVTRLKGLPKLARDMGVTVGQKWKGKDYLPSIKDRVIEVSTIDATGIIPKIISSKSSKNVAKHITFEVLHDRYQRVE